MKRTSVVFCALAFASLLGLLPQVGRAAVVTPTGVTASSEFGTRPASFTIDGSGLDPVPANVLAKNHNESPETGGGMWLTNNFATGTITFDLGQTLPIDVLHVWNYAEVAFSNTVPLTFRGAKNVAVYIDNTPNPTTLAQNFVFGQATPANSVNFAGGPNWGIDYNTPVANYPLTTAVAGRYIKFDISSNFPGSDAFVGLSEVRFNSQKVIVSDDFAGGGDGASTTGRAPNLANLPGGTWSQATSQVPLSTTLTAGFGNPLVGAFQQAQSASGVSISSNGGYVKPTTFTIQADLSPKTLDGPASAGRGISLGFYSVLDTDPGDAQFSQAHFTGLVLDQAGSLNLAHDPNQTGFFTGPGSFLGAAVPYAGGTFDPNAFYTLRYDVNTTTGAISNITLSGSTANYSSLFATTLFTDAATAFAGSYGSGGTGGTLGGLDNFIVFTVPEPSSLALLGFGLAALVRVRRRSGK